MTFDGAPADLWVPATLTNSWVNFGGLFDVVQYRAYRVGGGIKVELDGVAKNGTLGASLFTLPSNLTPPNTVIRVGMTQTVGATRVDITNAGTVIFTGASSNIYHSLAGISFWL